MKNHLLIAGVTGSGKSYLENQIIKKLSGQFIYIDPKMVELADHEGQSTCKRYAADIDEIIDALDDAIAEMDSRFTVMRARKEKLWTGSYLYIVIDELADLMLSDRKKTIRQQLATLATKGRAAKVILICCTQVTTQDVMYTCCRRDGTVSFIHSLLKTLWKLWKPRKCRVLATLEEEAGRIGEMAGCISPVVG